MKKNIEKTTEKLPLNEYALLLESIKNDIQQTQLKAAQELNSSLILLYWRTGKAISLKMTYEGWGAKTIDKLALDLKWAFPGMSGFSARNLRYMRKFAETYQDYNFAAAAAKLPWGQNMVIMDSCKNIDQMLWYIQKSLDNGWSRNVLRMWIESDLYGRRGKALTNFKTTLPKQQSDLAQETLKDPYSFSFLTIEADAREKEIEKGLLNHIQSFLIELGQGFSFVGRQYHLAIGKKDFYIDLLFYHLKLRCFVVVELKTGEFEIRDAAQLNVYLAAADDLLRHPTDNPSIGLLLVKIKDDFIAEYTLRDLQKPIGIAGYTTKLVESFPKDLEGILPSVKEIEAELGSRKKRDKE